MRFRNNEVRLQLHALAYNLANFMRTLALPEAVKHWSLTSLRQKLVKIGARIIGHGRYVTFQMAEVAVPRGLFDEILLLIAQLRAPPAPSRTALNIASAANPNYCILTNSGSSGECRFKAILTPARPSTNKPVSRPHNEKPPGIAPGGFVLACFLGSSCGCRTGAA
jgi:hypothetical protein